MTQQDDQARSGEAERDERVEEKIRRGLRRGWFHDSEIIADLLAKLDEARERWTDWRQLAEKYARCINDLHDKLEDAKRWENQWKKDARTAADALEKEEAENDRLTRLQDSYVEQISALRGQVDELGSELQEITAERNTLAIKLESREAKLEPFRQQLEAAKEREETLFDAVKHGDDKHRAWLQKAIADHFAGRSVERPRGKGTTEVLQAENEKLRARVEELELERDTRKAPEPRPRPPRGIE